MAKSVSEAAPVKVVMIEYHHVQTDVSNFKSVVQRLTGKRSCSAVADTSLPGGDTTKRRSRDLDLDLAAHENSTTPFLHSMSFKDLDHLLKFNIPSIEDLDWIWADN